MTPLPATGIVQVASGLSGDSDPAKAAEHACAQAGAALGSAHVAMLFVSAHHVDRIKDVAEIVRRELRPDCLIGVSGESVLGGGVELDGQPGVAVLAAKLPGVTLVPFTAEELLPFDDTSAAGLSRLGRAFGATEDLRGVFLFADPFSVPVGNLIPAMCRARVGGRAGTLVGGLASAGNAAGGNALVLDDAIYRAGAVGVSLRGPVTVDAVVSQGCRPVGPNFVITAAKRNAILSLSGVPALEAVRNAVQDLAEPERKLLEEKGLFMGRVINEYKDRFGRGDYLIMAILGADERAGAMGVASNVRVGQTVRLHVRDATTADEDLALLLDAQQLRERPAGGVLFTCNGRGRRLFDAPNHDAAAVCRAFRGRSDSAAEERSKGGERLEPGASGFPLAGFFAAGEIGPIGDESFIHGHTACLALLRPA